MKPFDSHEVSEIHQNVREIPKFNAWIEMRVFEYHHYFNNRPYYEPINICRDLLTEIICMELSGRVFL